MREWDLGWGDCQSNREAGSVDANFWLMGCIRGGCSEAKVGDCQGNVEM